MKLKECLQEKKRFDFQLLPPHQKRSLLWNKLLTNILKQQMKINPTRRSGDRTIIVLRRTQ